MSQVSFTIPLESNALRRTITMLQGMESDLHSTPTLPEFSITSNGVIGTPLPEFCAEADRIANIVTRVEELQAPVEFPTTEQMGEFCEAMFNPSQAFATSQSDVPPPPPPATTKVELDSEGMPWDARIHTTARTKVANGTWKLARNTPQELVTSVKSEYLGNVPPPPSMSPTTSNVNTVAQQVAPIGDVPPPPPPPSTDEPARDPVRVFMSDIAKAGRMPSEINAALQKHGVQTLQLIRNFPEKIPDIRLELGL